MGPREFFTSIHRFLQTEIHSMLSLTKVTNESFILETLRNVEILQKKMAPLTSRIPKN